MEHTQKTRARADACILRVSRAVLHESDAMMHEELKAIQPKTRQVLSFVRARALRRQKRTDDGGYQAAAFG